MSTPTAKGKRPILILIDGHALAYRAYYALGQAMSSPEGEPTSATFGFVSMLLQVLERHAPEHLGVTFDRGRSGRELRYPEYKANRSEQPADLAVQLDRIREIVEAFGIPIYELAGFEADDVIGSLAVQASAAGLDSLIVTGDSDLLQLVDAHTRVEVSGRRFTDSRIYDAAAVEARYGIPPDRMIQWKGLKGDSSDNIPGVPGIGEKTATDLIQRYGTAEAAIAAADEISAKRLRENLREHADAARLSVELVTIRCDLPVALDLERGAFEGYDREAVMAILRRLGFRSLVDRLPSSGEDEAAEREAAAPDGEYRTVTSLEALAALCERLAGAQRLAFDTETTGVDPMQAELVGIALSDASGKGWYIPVGHRRPSESSEHANAAGSGAGNSGGTGAPGGQMAMDFGMAEDAATGASGAAAGAKSGPAHGSTQGGAQRTKPTSSPESDESDSAASDRPETAEDSFTNLPLADVLDALRPILGGRAEKLAHHAKYDILILRQHGLEVAEPVFDSLVATWLVEPSRRALGLKDLAWSELGVEMTPISDLIGRGRDQISMAEVPVNRAAPYAAADVDMTMRLVEKIEPELDARGARKLFDELEMPVAWILADMEQAGIRVDTGVLELISADLAERAGELEARVHAAAGRPFNIASPKQLGAVLFEEMGLPAGRRTKTGPSTSAGALADLAAEHTIVRDVLDWRHVQKLRGTYVDALPALVNPDTGRIHTSWHQTSAVTGRLSSSNPNMQNIPVRSELGGQIRRAFVPEPGKIFLAADYSQMELRILASISGDAALQAVFAAGGDIHAATGAFLFDKAPEEVSSNERRIAKAVNFGTVYGISAFGLARLTGLPRADAAAFIDRYFELYPGVRQFFDRLLADAGQRGYVETIMGRRRYFPQLAEDSGADHNSRQRAEREAVNAPIQGSAADITKVAMIGLHRSLRERGLAGRMLLQVHDELLLELPESELAETAALCREIMSGAAELAVEMVVDLSAGENWADLSPIRR
jgi:DNA polymerase-1